MAKFNSETEARRSETNLIAPSKIKLPAFTGRKFRTEAMIKSLAESIKRDGQLQAVGVKKLDDGSPEAIFGITRVLAGRILEAEDAEFRLEVKTFTAEDAKAYAILQKNENVKRGQLSDMDIAYLQEEFRTVHGMSNKDIAAEFECDPAKVTRLKKLLKLSEKAQEMVHNGSLATAAGVEMSELTHDEQNAMLDGGIVKLSDVIEAIRKMKQPQPAPATPIVPQPASIPTGEPTNPFDLGNPVPAPVAQDAAPATNPAPDAAPTAPGTSGQGTQASETGLAILGLDFSKLNDESAPPKPNAGQRQRTIQQVKQVVGYYITDETNIVLRTFAAGLLGFIDGGVSEWQLEDIVRQIEGKAPIKRS